MSSTILRIITIAIAAPILILLLWFGKETGYGEYINYLIPIISIIAAYEFSKLANLIGFGIARTPFVIACAIQCFFFQYPDQAIGSFIVIYIIILALYIDAVRKRDEHGEPFSLLGWTIGLIYCGIVPATFARIYAPDEGFFLIMLLLITVWGFDIGAYVTGKLIGKKKLAPKISPNKTIEGVYGGWILASILCVGFAYIFSSELGIENPALHGLILALLLSIATQSGDLMESQLKRMAGVKDSGNLLPGHGGLLDRIDGLLIAAPIFYLYTTFVL